MDIQTVMVIGAGQMGTGIAQVCAQAGYKVYLYDVEEQLVNKGFERIAKSLGRRVDRGKMTEAEKILIFDQLFKSTNLQHGQYADVVIEAAIENMEIKKQIFAELDKYAPEHTILATNTSSLSITEIAAATTRPESVIGMHFMHPVPVMQLVEVIRGLVTTDDVYHAIHAMALRLNKTPVEVNDFPGFVSNRVLMPMINEAVYTLYEGVATKESIDQVMKLGVNHPMGPLELADFIGLDTCLYIMETLHEGFGDDKYRPCPLLRKYVKAGWLGQKSGRGFYLYD